MRFFEIYEIVCFVCITSHVPYKIRLGVLVIPMRTNGSNHEYLIISRLFPKRTCDLLPMQHGRKIIIIISHCL